MIEEARPSQAAISLTYYRIIPIAHTTCSSEACIWMAAYALNATEYGWNAGHFSKTLSLVTLPAESLHIPVSILGHESRVLHMKH